MRSLNFLYILIREGKTLDPFLEQTRDWKDAKFGIFNVPIRESA